jgi:outer membrane receptor for ferrienterochelin and colicins
MASGLYILLADRLGMNLSKHTRPMLFWWLTLAGLVANAEDSEDDLQALMALLEQETELATSTRMNADYVPGMVTVLYGQDARQAGKSSVADALGEVAGFYLIESNNGDKRAVVRGVGATQNANNLKILVDGIAVNRVTDGSADWVMRMPLAQVDRIEVVRGPGSAIHGGFAFSGVVNVITRSDQTLNAAVASHNSHQLGLNYHTGKPNTDPEKLATQFNLASWASANSGLQTGADNFALSGGNSPGQVYDHEKGQLLLANAAWQDYSLNIQHFRGERGPGYGYSAALPYEREPREERYSGIELATGRTLTAAFTMRASLLYQRSRLYDAAYIPLPIGISPPGGGQPAQSNMFRRDGNQDSSWSAALDLHWQLNERHLLFSQLGYRDAQVDDAFVWRAEETAAPVYADATANRVMPGSRRHTYSLTVQDQWQASEQVDVTYGLRHDRFSDWGSHTSPRLALVWRAGEHHILKAQYSEAYRPPTLQESNPGPASVVAGDGHQLQEETINTREMAYIYRAADQQVRLTLFHTHVSDLIEYSIIPGQRPVWRNRGDIETRGLELEWQQQFGRDWEWRSNVSLIKAEDFLDPDRRLLGAVGQMANNTLTWHASRSFCHSLSWQYTGEQEGWEINTRLAQEDRFPAYSLINYSLQWRDVLDTPGFLITLAGRNLTNAEYRSTAYPSQYPQGLPHGGRIISLELDYAL